MNIMKVIQIEKAIRGSWLALAACGMLLAGCDEGPRSFPFAETTVVKGTDVSADFAVKELNEIVAKATGRGFGVSGEKAKGKGEGEQRTDNNSIVNLDLQPQPSRRIFVGRSAEAEKILGKAFFDSLADEESVVTAKGNDLFLVGGGQLGCLYAVYDFVEDNLGFRQYFARDDGFVVDDLKSKSRGEVEGVVWNGKGTRKRPAFHGYRLSWSQDAKAGLLEVRNRCNAWSAERLIPGYRHPLTPRIPGHGFNPFLLPPYDPKNCEREIGIRGCFKEHPEWFSLGKDGKRHDDMQVCLSNPGARQKMFDNLLLWVKARGAGTYMVGSNDNHNTRYCNCEGCIALEKKYDSVGGPLWDWILWACPKLKELGYDDAIVSSLAYKGPNQTERAPKGVTAFPDNFNCDAAFLNSDRSLVQVPDETLADGTVFNRLANLRNWSRLCKHVSYWYYGGANPAQFQQRIRREMRELYEAGVESVGFCGTGGGYEFGDFTRWLAFRLLQDPYYDPEPDLKRIFAVKYGPAAAKVREYADLLERIQQKATETLPTTTGCDDPYSAFTFLTGEDILALRKVSDEALALAKGTPFEQNVHQSRLGLNIWTLTYFHKIKSCDPAAAAKIDCAAEEAEARQTIDSFKALSPYSRGYLLNSLNEMANYANLKDDTLPPELKGEPADKVFRILPPKRAPHICGGVVPNVYTCEADPKAVSGWAWTDPISAKYDASKGIGVEVYDEVGRQWLWRSNQNQIPLKNFKKGEYTLWKLCTTRLPNRVSIVVASNWSGPTRIFQLGRLFDPSYQNRQWEIWISARGEGPKFFADEDPSKPSRIWIDQVFAVDKGVPEGK